MAESRHSTDLSCFGKQRLDAILQRAGGSCGGSQALLIRREAEAAARQKGGLLRSLHLPPGPYVDVGGIRSLGTRFEARESMGAAIWARTCNVESRQHRILGALMRPAAQVLPLQPYSRAMRGWLEVTAAMPSTIHVHPRAAGGGGKEKICLQSTEH